MEPVVRSKQYLPDRHIFLLQYNDKMCPNNSGVLSELMHNLYKNVMIFSSLNNGHWIEIELRRSCAESESASFSTINSQRGHQEPKSSDSNQPS